MAHDVMLVSVGVMSGGLGAAESALNLSVQAKMNNALCSARPRLSPGASVQRLGSGAQAQGLARAGGGAPAAGFIYEYFRRYRHFHLFGCSTA